MLRTAYAMAAFAMFSNASISLGVPRFQGLGALDISTFQSEAWSVSADGCVIVGTSWSESGYQAFRWTQATGMVGLGYLPRGGPSYAYGVSADGSTVVGWSGDREAFRWVEGEGMTGLGDLSGGDLYSQAISVSGDGSVVVGQGTTPTQQAFTWSEGHGMQGIPGMLEGRDVSTDGSVVVGGAHLWSATSGLIQLGGEVQETYGISADGQVAVGVGNFGRGLEAFRWTTETGPVGLGDLEGGEFYSRAHAVSSDGIIVGESRPTPGTSNVAAFIWDETHSLRSLRDVLTNEYALDLDGWWLTSATDISPDGRTVIGWGVNPDGNGEAWVAHIPEPTALLLLALGGVGALSRSRRHASDTSNAS